MHTCEERLSIELATQYYNESDHDVLGHHEVLLCDSNNGYYCSNQYIVHPAAMMTYSLELVSPKLSVKVLTRWNSTDLTVNSLNRVIDVEIERNVIRLHMTTL
jgi:hypothetical protein